MSTQLTACLFIFALTCAGYTAGVWSLSVVAMASLTALTLTGCLSASEALSCFSNGTVIMVGAMSVVAAGFGRTRFCSRLAAGISRVAKGSLSRILLLYCLRPLCRLDHDDHARSLNEMMQHRTIRSGKLCGAASFIAPRAFEALHRGFSRPHFWETPGPSKPGDRLGRR